MLTQIELFNRYCEDYLYALNNFKSEIKIFSDFLKYISDDSFELYYDIVTQAYAGATSPDEVDTTYLENVIVFYSLNMSKIEHPEKEMIELDGDFKWLLKLNAVFNFEKLRRMELVGDYNASLLSEYVDYSMPKV